MRRQKYWILLTGPHITNTYIPRIGDYFSFSVSPKNMVRKDDIVYFWLNYDKTLYGWGEVAESPQINYDEIPMPDGEVKNRKRQVIRVHRKQEFHPRITESAMLQDNHLRKLVPTGFDDLQAIPLSTVQAHYINDFVREHYLEQAPPGSASVRWLAQEASPQFIVKALLTFGGDTPDGQLVEAVNRPWFEIIKIIQRDPEEIYKISWREWEMIVAGAYELDGADVILTPRSKDKGRDIIATYPHGSVRIFDQVKRYALTNIVDADEVRSMLGVLMTQQNVSKAIISTTSTFAPGVADEFKDLMPYRLELRPRNILLPWLEGLL